MTAINLYSDTQTRPSDGMRAAIAAAEVGDEQRWRDPTDDRLQERVAELLGHEAAVFLPSGTMCNEIALRLHIRPGGDELIVDRTSHPVNSKAGGPAALAGAMVRTLDGDGGIYTADQLRAAVRSPGSRYMPRPGWCGSSRPPTPAAARCGRCRRSARCSTARERPAGPPRRGQADERGGRLGVPAREYAAGFDTAWIDFTKGLGAPVGAVLAGSAELIAEAWRYKQMLGGAFRQSGIVAAACLYALDHNVDRLAEDHARARMLADGLAAVSGVTLDPDAVETNIVVFEVSDAARW